MKKQFRFSITLLFCAFAWGIYAQQPTIVVTNATGTSSAVYHTLKDAIKNASAGSFLYLSGGAYTNTLNDTIDKELHLIGAGYHPEATEATLPTNITNRIVVNTEAKKSTFEGMNLSLIELRTSVEDITFKRVYFSTSSSNLQANNLKSLKFYECIFICPIGWSFSQNFVLKNCIITSSLNCDQSLIENCIFTYASGSFIRNTYKNNIFKFKPGYSSISFSSNNNFYNNIFDINPIFASSEIDSGNKFNIDLSTLFSFLSSSSYYTFNINHKFLLTETENIKNANYGIYGGALPFKDKGIPSNPHIETKMISGQTDASGNLNVKVTVKAQSN